MSRSLQPQAARAVTASIVGNDWRTVTSPFAGTLFELRAKYGLAAQRLSSTLAICEGDASMRYWGVSQEACRGYLYGLFHGTLRSRLDSGAIPKKPDCALRLVAVQPKDVMILVRAAILRDTKVAKEGIISLAHRCSGDRRCRYCVCRRAPLAAALGAGR